MIHHLMCSFKNIEETNYTTSQLKAFYEWDGKIE